MIEINLPLMLALLVALGIYLAVDALAWGLARPDLATWLRDRERRPPVLGGAAPEPARRLAGAPGLGRLLTATASQALHLADALSLGHPARLARRLALAGAGSVLNHWTQKCLAALGLALVGAALTGLSTLLGAGGLRLIALPWWLPLLAGGIGLVIPDWVVARDLQRRQALIRREVPALLDQLTLALATSQGIQGGLARAIERGGPLAPLLAAVLTSARSGASATIASGLHYLADEWDLPEIHSLATTINLGDRAGITMRQALTHLAADLRVAERVALERQGAVATIRQVAPVATLMVMAFGALLLLPALALLVGIRPPH